uniref:N-acetyltransferase domain-containing protein n=1 Tax=Panagrolaimus davidi TaxID=227884 RepID=A0A914P4K1_9BILA
MRRRLLLHDGFFLNTRKSGERKVVNPAWKPKDGKNPLRIEIAEKKDLELVANFFNHHFTSNNNLRKALGATYEDMEEFSYDRAELAVKKPRSYLVFDGNKLVAASLRTYYTKDEYFKIFNGELFHQNPKFLIKDDYAEDIRSKGYGLNASRIAVLNEACISQIGKFLPSDVENLDFEIATGVHPDYTRNGLTQYLIHEGTKSCKDFKCNYRFGIAVAEAAYEATKKVRT